jgi:hypothetical protein
MNWLDKLAAWAGRVAGGLEEIPVFSVFKELKRLLKVHAGRERG